MQRRRDHAPHTLDTGRDPLPLIDAEEEEEEDESDTLEKKERRSDAQTLAQWRHRSRGRSEPR